MSDKGEYGYKARNKSLTYASSFHLHHPWRTEWHLASLVFQEDGIWLDPKIVMLQSKDESAFSYPEKIKIVPKLSS